MIIFDKIKEGDYLLLVAGPRNINNFFCIGVVVKKHQNGFIINHLINGTSRGNHTSWTENELKKRDKKLTKQEYKMFNAIFY